MKLKIPKVSKYTAGTMGFYVSRTPELDQTIIDDFASYSTFISLFEYHFGANGDLVNVLHDIPAIKAAWNRRVTPLATITNLTAGGFSASLAQTVLNNPAARTNLINNISYLVSQKGYGGVNIDIENVRREDRDLYTGFLRQLRDRLAQSGYLLTVSVPAKTNLNEPWMGGYDYGGIGSVVHYMFIMAYDWHHSASGPGPVAPIKKVRQTMQYAVERVLRKKIILGVPLYGYDWQIPQGPGKLGAGAALSNAQAIERAMLFQVPIRYSNEHEAPFFRYQNQKGILHEVWFEDVRSIGEKLKLIREFGLYGAGAWQLSLNFAPGPWLLKKFFKIRKV